MEHIQVNAKLRMETLKLSMAPVIFETIDRNRHFLDQWLPFVRYTLNLSDTEMFIKNIQDQPGKKRDMVYSIWYREDFAGLIGFKDTDWINHKTELGYWLAPEMQGKGIITSCVQTLLKVAFYRLKMNRVQIKVARGNEKSAAIPQKLNFKYEGTERAGEWHNNQYFDLDVFSFLKSDL